jgi:hypothetical protein
VPSREPPCRRIVRGSKVQFLDIAKAVVFPHLRCPISGDESEKVGAALGKVNPIIRCASPQPAAGPRKAARNTAIAHSQVVIWSRSRGALDFPSHQTASSA